MLGERRMVGRQRAMTGRAKGEKTEEDELQQDAVQDEGQLRL